MEKDYRIRIGVRIVTGDKDIISSQPFAVACVINSNTVRKSTFLNAYKISEESGKLFTFNEFFKTEGDNPGTVYETEIGNKIYYSEKGERGNLDILSKNKLLDEWSNGDIFFEAVHCIFKTVRVIVSLSQIKLSAGYPFLYSHFERFHSFFSFSCFQATYAIPVIIITIGRLGKA